MLPAWPASAPDQVSPAASSAASLHAAPVVKQAAPKGPIRISAGVVRANCISCPQPIYPQIAKAAHVQGTVVIQAVISKGGTVENVQVLSGPPLLRQAAVDAVRNFRYKPTILSGEAVEVQADINVVFTFNGG